MGSPGVLLEKLVARIDTRKIPAALITTMGQINAVFVYKPANFAQMIRRVNPFALNFGWPEF